MKQTDLISVRDQAKLSKLLRQLSQTVLITAPGLSELNLALAFLTRHLTPKTTWIVHPDETGKIKIEVIRQLLASVTTKTDQPRYFLIYQADAMNQSAQNSFLKTLEEPGRNQYFYLLTTDMQKILPTVRSRAQKVRLSHLPKTRIREYLKQQFPNMSIERFRQAEFIASDNFDLWQQLLLDDELFTEYHQLATWARQLVERTRLYDRLVAVRQVGKDRQKAERLVKLILKIYQTLLLKQADSLIIAKINIWLKVLDRLQANGSVQLVLTWAVIQ